MGVVGIMIRKANVLGIEKKYIRALSLNYQKHKQTDDRATSGDRKIAAYLFAVCSLRPERYCKIIATKMEYGTAYCFSTHHSPTNKKTQNK